VFVRFGLVHRVLLDALVALGMLSLVTTGEFARPMGVALMLLLGLSAFVPVAWQESPAWRFFGTYSPVVLLTVQLVRWSQGANPLSVAVEFAAILQILRVATRRGAAHDQQIIALALLHLVAATVLGTGLAYACCFIGFVLVTPPALLLSHLRREVEGNYRQGARDRTGLPVDVPRILRSRRVVSRGFLAFVCCLSIPVVLFTALLFIAFPRVGLSLLMLEPTRPTRMVGFSDQVDLGKIGALRSDPTIAIRVTYPSLPPEPPPRIALYLRGTAFDRYESRSWRRTQEDRKNVEVFGNVFPLSRYPKARTDPAVTVDLEPIEPPVLFMPEAAIALELMPTTTLASGAPSAIQLGPENEIRYSRIDDRRGIRYRVFVDPGLPPPPQPLTSAERARYLALPPEVSSAIAELARKWAYPETQPERIAQQIQQHLRADYTYDLNGPSGREKNPLEHFLFVSKRGHCEFYSTAMALMLRTLSIPTRNVTGFAGATYNRFGQFYAVRQGDAHSWVEVWTEHHGWRRYDPTPAAPVPVPTEWSRLVTSARDMIEAASQRWNRHVERYDLHQQIELFSGLRRQIVTARHAVRLSGAKHLVWLLLVLPAAWIYRARLARKQRNSQATEKLATHINEIVRQYRVLERHLEQLGIGRPASTPPLAHAEALVALGNPVAAEVLELTQQYLEVRFGGAPFDAAASAEYTRKIQAMRRSADARAASRAA
jgi:transglutaminase-like putative cysteine protease